MIRAAKSKREIVINLDGPDGNVFSLMSNAKRLAREVGYTFEKQNTICEKMMSGDYVNAVKTFDKYFGEFVILETTDKDLLNG